MVSYVVAHRAQGRTESGAVPCIIVIDQLKRVIVPDASSPLFRVIPRLSAYVPSADNWQSSLNTVSVFCRSSSTVHLRRRSGDIVNLQPFAAQIGEFGWAQSFPNLWRPDDKCNVVTSSGADLIRFCSF
jgi:hypothetical protein